ncbi:hypothetical protein REJC140_02517 [Pseudorhizobium endolithicum]|uniref:DUF6455 domain-containing protein n=1 Tax=Pseudorhizobium endolithicum TaxID=1191678 RepID=A0ABM8PFX3_9HYPH|nr:DUF6455 family protein [Pseudorhizobium endolithicum]CAD7027566.1 hypothetical protein REJC140_02517 [Pseudorhizobium endolithicum]
MGLVQRIGLRLERQSHLMSMMMERLGVDQELAGQEQLGLTMAHAVRSCIFCRYSAACEEWLSAGAGRTPPAGPEFCGNREFFSAHS